MSYSIPPGNLADASWVGANAYAPPPGGAADAEWQDSSYDVFVAAATPLGVPSALTQSVLQTRTAGTVVLGSFRALAITPVFVQATGLSFAAFGLPTAASGQQTVGIYSTVFGTPSSPVSQTVRASSLTTPSQLGTPVLFLSAVVQTNVICAASPVMVGRLGAPHATTVVAVRPNGSIGGHFGTPNIAVQRSAQPVGPFTLFGLPTISLSSWAQGYSAAAFGVPTGAVAQRSTSVSGVSKWGTPTCVRSNTYLVRGTTPPLRFGKPRGRKINAYQASAVEGSGQFGAPDCAQRYRALGAYDGARFGKPLLRRNPTC